MLQVISCSDQCMYLGIADIVALTSIIRCRWIFFVIRLCDKDNIALVMFSVLISSSVTDMSVVTSWIVHLVHSFSSFLILIPRLPVFVYVVFSHCLSISSYKWWRGRWWKLLIRRIHSISFLKPSALPCCVIG